MTRRDGAGLRVDDDELVACVACGLCLPHCPTYRVTGEESASPRGRIAAMRAVHFEGRPLDDDFTRFMDLCVQCRACEAVCPSSVPFGHLMEGARDTLATATPLPAVVAPGGLPPARPPPSAAGRVDRRSRLAQRAQVVPRRLGLPSLPLRRAPLVPTGTDVWLFTGCVMDAWMRPTHAAVLRVLTAAGAGVALPGSGRRLLRRAARARRPARRRSRRCARRVMASMPGDAPVLVDSAGCGAALKDYGHLVGTPEAERFAARVHDVREWLAPRVDRLPRDACGAAPATVAVQDPCHLRHVQKAHEHVRTVLRPVRRRWSSSTTRASAAARVVPTRRSIPSSPARSATARSRPIRRSGAAVVASANPGCAMHLAAAGLVVRHPFELIDDALGAPMAGEFDDIRAPAREHRRGARRPRHRPPAASRSTRAAPSCPSTSAASPAPAGRWRRRRAILREPDDAI